MVSLVVLFGILILLFAVIGATLRMADDDIGATDVHQHLGADIAGMRAGYAGVAILRPKSDPGGLRERREGREKRCRRTDQDFAARLLARGKALRQTFDLGRAGLQTVHFPVSGHQGARRRRYAHDIVRISRNCCQPVDHAAAMFRKGI